MIPLQVLGEIQSYIAKLIEVGLSSQQNAPILTPTGRHSAEISIAGAPNLAVAMKNIPYRDIYDELSKSKAFHIRMIDGAMIQLCYRFERDEVVAHRLCVFPSPDLDPFDSDPELYERDELFADIVGRNIVHVPIRFDFDAAAHKDVVHPKSHLTLGQYTNCRIPVSAPLSPGRFMQFVLRNFYFAASDEYQLFKLRAERAFGETITVGERALIHVNC